MQRTFYSNYVDEKLKPFKRLFKDKRTYKQFRIAVYGFLAAADILGLTSLINGLCLDDKAYDALDNYFKNGSWDLEEINRTFIKSIGSAAPLHHVNGRIVACGDGKKEPTDAKKFPNTSKEEIQSESASKKTGLVPCLNYSCISVVCDIYNTFTSWLIMARICNGNKETEKWQGRVRATQPVKMAQDFQKALKILRQSAYLALDRFYLGEPILAEWESYHTNLREGEPRYDLVMRAKTNIVAYKEVKPDSKASKKRGRPRKHDSFHLMDLFESRKEDFVPLEITIHGEKIFQEVLCETFLWGKEKRELNVLLSRRGEKKIILVSTDLDLSPAEMIEIYTCRFSIETSFRQNSECFGMFNARFHAQCLKPFNVYAKKEDPAPCALVKDAKDRKKVLKTMKAHEGFALNAMIAAGIAQMFRLECMENPSMRLAYQRTYSSNYSLPEAKKDLSRRIMHDLSHGGINGINSLLAAEQGPLYQTKTVQYTDRGKNRICRRAC